MKPILLSSVLALAAAAFFTPTLSFADTGATTTPDAAVKFILGSEDAKRGRGRGGDDARDDDRDDDRDDSSGRDRPRIPGGSGCDDPGDLLEHSECRVGLGGVEVMPGLHILAGRGHGGRPRIPGGSGCDDPEDLIEHPECRL